MRWTQVYNGEWVMVNNLMNKHFAASRPCELCMTMHCGRVWYSSKTKTVRCLKCFKPSEAA